MWRYCALCRKRSIFAHGIGGYDKSICRSSLSANYLYRVLTLKRNHNETVDTNPLQK